MGTARRNGLARRVIPTLALPALVGLSTVLHWLAARRVNGLWIIPDEPVYALRALAVWRHGPFGLLHGHDAGYGLLYPLLAGVPLSMGSTLTGYHSLKLLQALVVSLAAVPVFAYGRRLMPAMYAFVAAVLTVASPLLLYSGFVMTEVVFYPLAALVLLAIARAIASATLRDQLVALALVAAAILTRTQAVAFLAVFALAILVEASLARDRTRPRAFWPVWVVCALGLLLLIVRPGVVGAYSGTLSGDYASGAALRLTYDHLAYVVLSTGVVPFAALVLLMVGAARRREPDPAARAFLALVASAICVVVVQVGFFASRYAPHLLGRDLAALPPLLFLALALWLARGAPRPRFATTLVSFGVLCVVLLAPWNELVTPNTFPDSFDLTLFAHIHRPPTDVVTVFSLVAVATFVAIPRPARLVLPLVVLVALVPASVFASRDVARAANVTQTQVVGPAPNWIDRAARGPVVFLYGSEQNWGAAYQERFWNRRIDRVITVAERVPGPLAQTSAAILPDGRLPVREPYLVATDRFEFVGVPVAHLAQSGLDVSGLTLWRLERPARVDLIKGGVHPNGDMTGPATISVYNCRKGRLELTLLPKATDMLRILLNGRAMLGEHIAGALSWHGSVSVPSTARPRVCTFTIVPQLLLGSTRIAFVRD